MTWWRIWRCGRLQSTAVEQLFDKLFNFGSDAIADQCITHPFACALEFFTLYQIDHSGCRFCLGDGCSEVTVKLHLGIELWDGEWEASP